MTVDANGFPIEFELTGGEVHDSKLQLNQGVSPSQEPAPANQGHFSRPVGAPEDVMGSRVTASARVHGID